MIADGLKDTPKILLTILDGRITGLGLVPAGLEIVKSLARKKAGELGRHIRYIELGSSAILPASRAWLFENFPNTVIWHHYGMTEASRSFFVRRGFNLIGRCRSCWRVSAGVRWRLVDVDGWSGSWRSVAKTHHLL